MAKILDITDKLDFDSNPKLVIKGKKYEVNADAETVLRIMGVLGNSENVSPASIVEMYELIFNKKVRNQVKELKLQFSDFQKVVMEAVNLIIGGEEQGEQ